MSVNDIAQVRVIGTYVGQQVNAVMHFRFKTAGASLAGLLSQLEASTTTFRDMFVGSMSNQLVYNELQGTMLIPFGTATQVMAISPTWAGSDVSSHLPPSVAVCISKRTDLIGRARRGRLFLAGAPMNANSGLGTWTSAFVSAKQGHVNGFGAEYGEGGINADYEAGVWSRLLAGPTPPFSFSAYQAIDTMVVRSQCRSQRRREVGVGA